MGTDHRDFRDENDNYTVTDQEVLKEFHQKEGNPPQGEWRPSKNNPYVMEWWGMGGLMAEMEEQNASRTHDVGLENESKDS